LNERHAPNRDAVDGRESASCRLQRKVFRSYFQTDPLPPVQRGFAADLERYLLPARSGSDLPPQRQ
jgi:hypothetical protein